MTDAYTPANSPEDIDDATDRPSLALDQQADALLNEPRSYRPVTSVRGAMREDVGLGRDWLREKRDLAVEQIEEKPLKATLYALGAGLLIGLLIAR